MILVTVVLSVDRIIQFFLYYKIKMPVRVKLTEYDESTELILQESNVTSQLKDALYGAHKSPDCSLLQDFNENSIEFLYHVFSCETHVPTGS